MHAFIHLIARTHIKIKAIRAIGLSSLDVDIMNTENAITSLEISNSLNAADLSHLEELYAKFTVL